MWASITQSLLVRNHASSIPFAEKLFGLFDDGDDEVAWDAARAVGVIGGSEETLTKQNHAIIRVRLVVPRCRPCSDGSTIQMLWAQKYCNTVLPKLVNGAQDFKSK